MTSVGLVAGAACTDDARHAKGGPPCPADGTCVTNLASAGATTGAGGGGGGGAAAVDVSGVVAVLISSTFDQSQLYAGEATVVADQAGGGTVSAPWGGDAGALFTLHGVASNARWLLVDNSASASAIVATYSTLVLSASATVTAPVVDTGVLDTVAGALLPPVAIDPSAAQIILALTRSGAPLAGVRVSSPPSGAVVAYDQGAGAYSTDALATGAGGIILLLNVPASTAQASDVTLAVNDAQPKTFALPIRLRGHTATVAHFAL